MKIVQTFFTNTDEIKALNGGWLNTKYHLVSWALSSCLLKKHFNCLELITDCIGKNILIDELRLPYDQVRIELSDSNSFQEYPRLWVLKKIFSHTLHDEPFLHIDSDVFVFKKFSESLLNQNLISQNKQYNFDVYNRSIEIIMQEFEFIPSFLTYENSFYGVNSACNMGIIGGQDFSFFKTFYASVMDFISKNKKHIAKIPTKEINTTIEEFYFYQLAQFNNKKISYLFNYNVPPHYPGFSSFHQVPDRRTYLHLMMGYKQCIHECEQMSRRLKIDFPETYARIQSFLKKVDFSKLENKKPPFYRTMKSLSPPIESKKSNLEVTIPKLLNKKSISPELKKLYLYEKGVFAFYKTLNQIDGRSIYQDFESQLINYDAIFCKKTPISNWKISLSKFARLAKVEKQWIEANMVNQYVVIEENLSSNIKNQEQEINVLLYYHPETGHIGEYILLSEIIIFDWLSENKWMRLDVLFKKIKEYCKNSTKPFIFNFIIERLRFYIYQNALSLSKI